MINIHPFLNEAASCSFDVRSDRVLISRVGHVDEGPLVFNVTGTELLGKGILVVVECISIIGGEMEGEHVALSIQPHRQRAVACLTRITPKLIVFSESEHGGPSLGIIKWLRVFCAHEEPPEDTVILGPCQIVDLEVVGLVVCPDPAVAISTS